MSADIQGRFEALRSFGEAFAKAEEQKLQEATGLTKIRCFVHDQFEKSFPEEHLTRDGSVILFMRLSVDLKGLGAPAVQHLKQTIAPRLGDLAFLRPNFLDSLEELDFDWHLTEDDRAKDEAAATTASLKTDAVRIAACLEDLMQGD